MARQITVPKSAMDPIGLIASHSDKLHYLEAIVGKPDVGKQSPTAISDALARTFSEKAEISTEDARQIIAQLMAFHELRIGYKLSPSEFLDSVTQSLESDASQDWKEEHLENWIRNREVIQNLLDPNNPLSFVHKSLRLSYEHQNIIFDTRILTDIRPVFDDDGQDLVQMLVSHMLKIEFHDGAKRQKLYVSMGTDDLRNLTEACERAQNKETTLKTKLGDLPWSILVVGEEGDE